MTAANASGICDGAGAIILTNEAGLAKHNLKPLARIVSYQVSGVEPNIMGIGPVPAIEGALARANLTLADMDLIEINEAFAVQFLACQKVRCVVLVCLGSLLTMTMLFPPFPWGEKLTKSEAQGEELGIG